MAWKWSNSFIFNGEIEVQEAPLHTIRLFAKEVNTANKFRLCILNSKEVERNQITWRPPREGWVRLNTDGAYRSYSKLAGAGGLIRDHRGRWIQGFVHNIGCCSAEKAELWAISDGLKLAWELGFRRIEVELDASSIVDNLVLSKDTLGHQAWDNLLKTIHEMKKWSWEIKFRHIFGEGNSCTDWLASKAFDRELGCERWLHPPPYLQGLLMRDGLGQNWFCNC